MSRVTDIQNSRLPTLVLGMVAVFVIVAFSLFQPTSLSPGQVLIIGDSITEKPAIAMNGGNKGWWEYLLLNKTDVFKFSAESGSGYAAKGNRGTTFYDRLPDIARVKPKAIIIAGGVNDRQAADSRQAIRKYYDALARTLKQNHIPVSDVYVFVPRPAGSADNVTALIKSHANRIGVNFVSIPGYSTTFDGLHPDTAGAKFIGQNFAKNSNFDERLK